MSIILMAVEMHIWLSCALCIILMAVEMHIWLSCALCIRGSWEINTPSQASMLIATLGNEAGY